MKTPKLFTAIATTLLALGGAAQAGDALFSTTPVAFNWEGFYAGVQAGGGKFSVSNGNSDTAMVGGAHAGYLWQKGRFVFGPEFDVNATGWQIGGTQLDAIANAKLRGGFAFDRTLVTASVGYGHAWASSGGAHMDKGGLAVGAGIDFAATDRIIVGTDYTYNKIDSFGGQDTGAHTVRARLSFKFN